MLNKRYVSELDQLLRNLQELPVNKTDSHKIIEKQQATRIARLRDDKYPLK